jgi:DNA-binding NarL/FixJ family response regulator
LPGLRILIADVHEPVRRGLRALLEAQSGWQVIGEAQDGQEAVDQVAAPKPDIVVLEIGMPRLNGLEALRQITKTEPQTKVLVLTMHESDELIRAILDAGACGFATKAGATTELIFAIGALRKNKTNFISKVEQMMLDSFLHGTSARARGTVFRPHLTLRQREILQLLAEGKTSKEVAVQLQSSVKTAETHRANIIKSSTVIPSANWSVTPCGTTSSSHRVKQSFGPTGRAGRLRGHWCKVTHRRKKAHQAARAPLAKRSICKRLAKSPCGIPLALWCAVLDVEVTGGQRTRGRDRT